MNPRNRLRRQEIEIGAGSSRFWQRPPPGGYRVAFLAKTELGYDSTLQIQAATHILQGKGLTVFALPRNYFSDNELITLYPFPVRLFFLLCTRSIELGLAAGDLHKKLRRNINHNRLVGMGAIPGEHASAG